MCVCAMQAFANNVLVFELLKQKKFRIKKLIKIIRDKGNYYCYLLIDETYFIFVLITTKCIFINLQNIFKILRIRYMYNNGKKKPYEISCENKKIRFYIYKQLLINLKKLKFYYSH